ncbi:hypothetical protein N7452_000093 [Penicillium brevicompactum]|uniref:Uncharacterized protein n=1 Tax=Penicillium brevicompactum TaxID=5074 RepID=A0A9W9R215_PENBR|nr:hypothetical protein N7452_000093 [Penicillium brevicompactum]
MRVRNENEQASSIAFFAWYHTPWSLAELSGVGFDAAEAAIEYGATKVILSSSSQARIGSAIAKLKNAYYSSRAEIIGFAANLAEESTLEETVQTLFSKVGVLDHIIFTAGDAPQLTPFVDTDFTTMKQAGMVRFFAPLLVARYGHKNLAPGPASSITLTTGVSGEKPIAGWAVTSSYLSGLHGMMRGLALDLKPTRVNLVSPGGMDTAMWNILDSESKASVLSELGKLTTTGHVGRSQDIAEAYLYCMKDWNLTGTVISSNGGRLLV